MRCRAARHGRRCCWRGLNKEGQGSALDPLGPSRDRVLRTTAPDPVLFVPGPASAARHTVADSVGGAPGLPICEVTNQATRASSTASDELSTKTESMASQLNIKSEDGYRLATELSALTGESLTTAVTEALRERLEREQHAQDRAQKLARLTALAAEIRASL